MALLLILAIRTIMGEEAFADWGWRIPFLLSLLLLIVSIWIRLKLNESPVFQRMKEEGRTSKRPLSEAFGQWSNLKIAILALLGATAGEAVVWYGGQFYALFYLTQTLKVDATTAQIMIAVALAIGTPFFIFFGWLSDKIGRKPIMLLGFLLAAITYAPISPINIFKGITHYANPALERALCYVAGDGGRRPVAVLVPVQDDGHGKVHHLLRRGQGGARGSLGELRQRASAERHAGSRTRRRRDPSRRRSPTSPRRSLPPLPSTAIRPRPIRRRSTTR